MNICEAKKRALAALKGNWPKAILCGLIITLLELLIVIIPFGLIFSSALAIGLINFFIVLLSTKTVDKQLLYKGFKENLSKNIVLGLMKKLFLILWGIIPVAGIIKNYEYSLAEYVAVSNPNAGYNECIEISKEKTRGYKKEMFVFDISFTGWFILCILTFGIGFLFVIPYYMTARHQLLLIICKHNHIEIENNGDYSNLKSYDESDIKDNSRICLAIVLIVLGVIAFALLSIKWYKFDKKYYSIFALAFSGFNFSRAMKEGINMILVGSYICIALLGLTMLKYFITKRNSTFLGVVTSICYYLLAGIIWISLSSTDNYFYDGNHQYVSSIDVEPQAYYLPVLCVLISLSMIAFFITERYFYQHKMMIRYRKIREAKEKNRKTL